MALRGNRPPKEKTLERQRVAWRLRQKGWTQEAIAEQLGIDVGNVCRMLNRLNDEYLRENLQHVERVKVDQTRILYHIAHEALLEWERSKEPQNRVITQGDGTEILQAISRTGNVQYLHAARAAFADIRSIWGCDVAPAQQDATQGIAQLIRDIETRGLAVEVRKAPEVGGADPGGLPPGAGAGAPEVQGGPGEVQ